MYVECTYGLWSAPIEAWGCNLILYKTIPERGGSANIYSRGFPQLTTIPLSTVTQKHRTVDHYTNFLFRYASLDQFPVLTVSRGSSGDSVDAIDHVDGEAAGDNDDNYCHPYHQT